jgi:hypothetical protein
MMRMSILQVMRNVIQRWKEVADSRDSGEILHIKMSRRTLIFPVLFGKAADLPPTAGIRLLLLSRVKGMKPQVPHNGIHIKQIGRRCALRRRAGMHLHRARR